MLFSFTLLIFVTTTTHQHLTLECIQCSSRATGNICIKFKRQQTSLFELPLKNNKQCSSLGVSFPLVLFQCAQNYPSVCQVEQESVEGQHEKCRWHSELVMKVSSLLSCAKYSTKVSNFLKDKTCLCNPKKMMRHSQPSQQKVKYSRILEQQIVETTQSETGKDAKDAKDDLSQLSSQNKEYFNIQWWQIFIIILILVFICLCLACIIYHIIQCCIRNNPEQNEAHPPQYPQPQLNYEQPMQQQPEDPRYQIHSSYPQSQPIQPNIIEYPPLESQRAFQENNRNWFQATKPPISTKIF